MTRHFHVIHVALDDYIPFNEYFIIPYMLWFLYVAVTFAGMYLHDKRSYCQMCCFLFTGMTIFLIISSIYPNGHYMRPTSFTRENFCTDLVRWLYSKDTATNLFPSIHVFNSLGCHLAICHSDYYRSKKLVRDGSFVLMSSIIMSTVFLKQHSMFDVFTAFLMALVLSSLVYGKAGQRIPAYFAARRARSKEVQI